MLCRRAVALLCALATLSSPHILLANCNCQPPYESAPYSGSYRVEIDGDDLPLSGLHVAIDYAKGKWLGMLNSRGSGITLEPGGSIHGLRIIVASNVSSDGQYIPSQNILFIDRDNWDPSRPADYLQGLLMHELGHVFGLGQAPPGCGSVMSDTSPGDYRLDFSACDYEHFNTYYVPGPDPCATDPGLPQCSPLLIDTEGNALSLTAAPRGVFFDINADGVSEKVGWTAANSDDAWLAMDRNGNGIVDSGAELFGNSTPRVDGQPETSSNGFEVLKYLETDQYGAHVPDGVIDRNDQAFWRLLLWFDRNHNGVSEPEELVPVSSTPLTSISTDYRTVERRRKGNVIRQVSRVQWGGEQRMIADVWLAVHSSGGS